MDTRNQTDRIAANAEKTLYCSEDSVRLNKFISESGYCSRREADRLIEAGKVTVDGRAAHMGERVFAWQQICVNGKMITKEQEKVLLAVNKPRGVVCTTDKRWGDRTVDDLIRYPRRVFPVGRLDKDSEGLLLMTNQGDILNKILKSGNAHEKEYLVVVDREITDEFLEHLSRGVYLEELDVMTKPCKVYREGKKKFRIILTQGLNRQIRRMCAAFDYRVERLVRVRIMNIMLGELAVGAYRELSEEEVKELYRRIQTSRNHPVYDRRNSAREKEQ
ncbi:MAG: pseudouridine synthase [Lachnospiraceae bacterium]|nr:pseudouridine synthase [Lachnospiraceae bacterium]